IIMNMIKRGLMIILIMILVGVMSIAGINIYMCQSTQKQMTSEMENADCILVLGAGIRNNKPTPMLNDRLEQAISLYNEKKAPKIIMSGDHGKADYNEVGVMKKFTMDKGVPSSDIFMDHAGFSTYESLYRAKEIFQAKKIIIVTQDYHLYRALYIANQLGLEAVGVASNPREYSGQTMRDIREVAARCKDFITCIFKPEPTYLGDTIPVSGDGDITNDQAI
ncbi:SanA/YdcF family protein, partial [Candidatus Stoquefichus massiliensis]|uniref:SanA/YdcF family protein n=1 Tax=Candidatus Stoquefichus massiliensis TaxID=1470350 RepID=UPI001E3E074C